MNLKEHLKEIGKYGSIYMVGWIFTTVLRLGLLPVFTRHLDRAEYGTLSLLDSAIALIQILGTLGLTSAIIRFYHDKPDAEHKRRVIATGSSVMLLGVLLLAGILFPFSGELARLVLGENAVTLYFQLTLTTMLLGLLRTAADSYFTASKRATVFVIATIVQALLSAALNLYLVVGLRLGVRGMLTGNLIAAAAVSTVLFVYVLKLNGFGFDGEILRGMLRYGLPLVPSLLAAAAMHNLDRFFIREYAGLEAVGLYSIAYQFPFLLNAIMSNAFLHIWGSNTMFSIAQEPDSKRQFAKICTYFMTVLLYALFVLSIGAETLISIFAAPSYSVASRYLPVIALGVWGYSLHNFVRIGVVLTKKTHLMVINYFIALVINMGAILLVVPRFGAMGAAWATVLTYFCFSIGGYFLYRHCYSIEFEWGRLAKILGLAISLAAVRKLANIPSSVGSLLLELMLIGLFPVILFYGLSFLTTTETNFIRGWWRTRLSLSVE